LTLVKRGAGDPRISRSGTVAGIVVEFAGHFRTFRITY
jgi:hypothetical protein